MASDTSRPSTENGGSRPPTSRFVEGSMNDRVSATPPSQFLGPNQLKDFERQFYTEPPNANPHREQRRARRDRPFSESSVPEQQQQQQQQQANSQEHVITHRKSTGFFGRVRDALGWNSASRNNNAQKHESTRKHSSLQEPLQQPPLPPRPDHLRAAKSHSEMYNIPYLPNMNSGGARPSRDEVMQSYSQLMATGFFQSHAIHSTRHAGPGSRGNDRRSAPPVPPMPPMPSIPGSAPCSPAPPPRTSSIDATAASPTSPFTSPQRPAGPAFRTRVASQRHRGRTPSRPEAPVLQSMAPSHSLRGRKRNRADTDDNNAEAAGVSASSSFAQPLKRVAKKLRKTPSSTPKDPQTPDGVFRLPPSTSVGGTMYSNEKAVRLRSPSPATPIVASPTRRGAVPHQQQQQAPRRTFSNSSRGEGNRLRKRVKSVSLRSRTASGAGAGLDTWGRADDENSSIYQDATATAMDTSDDDGWQVRDALSVVPDANRGIPSVPRIPDCYHYYHKPGAPKGRYCREDRIRQDENANLKPHTRADTENREAQWNFGEAL
ncbi:hypothetical protein F4820DRAFT_428735 [Hypoxylon rubiginosum]|uniref:Uncharacterized protein n=1 Tax=Hypoxylon rubiginosum TaxID=110542 RepID=A0ACB9YU56_9PEZI|nr:hypothetical protein F4820DRAFT_428735 [Hypoxylon rubiginosum]